MFAMSWLIYTMAEDGLLFRFLAQINARTHTHIKVPFPLLVVLLPSVTPFMYPSGPLKSFDISLFKTPNFSISLSLAKLFPSYLSSSAHIALEL